MAGEIVTRHLVRLTNRRVLSHSLLCAPRYCLSPLPISSFHTMAPSRRSSSPMSSSQPKRQKNDAHIENPHRNGTDLHPAQHQVGTGTEGKHDWKKRPPYRVHEPNEHFDVKLTGSCHCGTVEFQLSRNEPLDSKLCHCTTCQKQHAAPFQWAAIFHKDDINFSKGHHNLEWYDPTDKSVEHKLPCKVRCSYCHSPIMDEGRNMILLFPSLIDLKTADDRKRFRPRLHMFYDQRVVDVPDGLPKWTGLNEESKLIEDSPVEKVREVARKEEEERKKRFEEGKNE